MVLMISVAPLYAQLPAELQKALSQPTTDSATIDQLNVLAFDYLKSDPEAGRKVALATIDKAKDIGYERGHARALNITGSSYWVVGEYELALDYYQLSAREAGAAGDSVGLSHAYHNMGEVYKKVGDLTRSIEYLNLSLDYDSRHNQPHAIALYNIGEAHLMQNKLSLAQSYFDKAIAQAIKEKSDRTIAYTHQGQALIKFRKREYVAALAYLGKAEALWNQLGELRSSIQTLQLYADVYFGLQEEELAQSNLQKAVELAAQIHATDLQIANFEKFSKIYAAQKDYEHAWSYLTQHNQLRDSLYTVKKAEQIARLQTLFETESRDIENNLLREKQNIKDAQIRSQQFFIIAVSIAMVLAGIVAWILYRQQRRIAEVNLVLNQKNAEIHDQKLEIESQANELQLLNQELSDLNRSLECRIEEKTRQVMKQNQKLIQYAHANAHQLRAPVVSIMGLLNLIEKLQLPDQEQVMINHLLKCAKELDQITRELARALEEEILVPESLNETPRKEAI